MEFRLEDRVFLYRNEKLLLFNEHGKYDGDSRNIDDYVDRGALRYITIETVDGIIKQTNYYFAGTTDVYLTQSGEWVHFRDAKDLPANELLHTAFENYYKEAFFDNKVRLITKTADKIEISVIGE